MVHRPQAFRSRSCHAFSQGAPHPNRDRSRAAGTGGRGADGDDAGGGTGRPSGCLFSGSSLTPHGSRAMPTHASFEGAPNEALSGDAFDTALLEAVLASLP